MNEELLERFFKCETTPQEEQRVHDWIHADPENQRIYDECDFIHNARLLYAPGEEPKRIWSHIFGSSWTKVAIQVAAVVAIALGVHFITASRYDYSDKMYSIAVPVGERIKITLEDSTVVWLNGGSRLTHPVLFAKNARRVQVEGEAFFDVAHDAGRPFVVETFLCDVEVLGTTFNVDACAQDGSFSAALVSGSVKVCNIKRGGSSDVILVPDDLLVYDNGRFRLEQIGNANVYTWEDGLINIQGLAFDEMMARFEKIFDVTINIERKSLPELDYGGGKFRKSYGIENVLHTLQLGSDFRYDFDKENNVITIR